MNKKHYNSLALTLALTLTVIACSKKEIIATGESFFSTGSARIDEKSVDGVVKEFFSKISPAVKNDYWPRNGYIPAENLSLSDGFDYKTSKAGSAPEKGFAITSTPVVAEGKVFTLGGNGELEARDINDISEVLWKTEITEAAEEKEKSGYIAKAQSLFTNKSRFIGGNICYSLGNIYVTTKRGNVYAVNGKNGEIIWNKNFGSIIRSTPLVRDDKLLFITSDNRTVTVATKDGSVLWQHAGLVESSKVMASPTPLLIGNKVIITYSSGEVFALDFNSGAQLWSAELNRSSYGAISAFMNDISRSPVAHRNIIYVVSSDGTLNALSSTGENIWSFEGETINNAVWPVGDFLFTTTRFGEIIAISAREGKLVWKNKMADPKDIIDDELQFTGLIMANEKLFAGDDNGTLYSYSPKTGEILKKHSIPSGVILNPVIAGGKMFLITKESTLVEVK
jgi:outer membrane protein assembly factor BamB